jgi:hypothetical protein
MGFLLNRLADGWGYDHQWEWTVGNGRVDHAWLRHGGRQVPIVAIEHEHSVNRVEKDLAKVRRSKAHLKVLIAYRGTVGGSRWAVQLRRRHRTALVEKVKRLISSQPQNLLLIVGISNAGPNSMKWAGYAMKDQGDPESFRRLPNVVFS